LNYYRRYVGDYLRDTPRLSVLEHGAYNLLLDYYYADEQPLPTDRLEVYTMVRAMTPADRKAVDKVLDKYFQLGDDGWHNKRADHEIEVSQKARDNGKKGGPKGGSGDTGLVTGNKNPVDKSPPKTGTGQATGIVTGDGGGSAHPPTTNHQPPSPSRQPPPTSQRRKSAALPATIGEIRPEVQVAIWLKSHGITAQASDPRVIQFAAERVTEQQIMEAVATARTRPGKAEGRIHFAYLCGILTDVMHPKAGAKGGSSGIDQWLDSQEVSRGTEAAA
jgi:uncharacterized protein YdaU (DUF1376 family)